MPEEKSVKHWQAIGNFPEEKIEDGELAELALKRELEEELDMRVENIQFFAEGSYSYETFAIHLSCYSCRLVSQGNRFTDHDQIAFIHPRELQTYEMAPADLFIVEKIIDLDVSIS